jgi:hypothetical protein
VEGYIWQGRTSNKVSKNAKKSKDEKRAIIDNKQIGRITMAKRCLVKIAECKAEQFELYWMLYIFHKELEYSG